MGFEPTLAAMPGRSDGRVTPWLRASGMLCAMSRTPVRAVAALLLLGALAGCGSAPERYRPTGVDELEIPTPAPDPDDFVDEIDNELLPLVPGTVWEYAVSDGAQVTVTVTDETREVAGVTTTVVRGGSAGADSWYAQDEDGNVWFFGAEGVWKAGVGGAEAGLAMPAEPRLGDGFVYAHHSDSSEELVEVVDVDASASTPYAQFDDVLETSVTTTSALGFTGRQLFAPGVGLVHATSEDGRTVVELVGFTAG